MQENVGDGNDTLTINGRQRHVIGYLQDFLFSPDRARTPVRILSGGERNRLLLAKLFTRPANILVLDEPTNDLDAETLDLLEELLLEFSGTLLLVSHDREFLNNVVTSTLVLTGDGTVQESVGGYDDWLRLAAAAAAAPRSELLPAAPLHRRKLQKNRPASCRSRRCGSWRSCRSRSPRWRRSRLSCTAGWPTRNSTVPPAARCRVNERLAALEAELTAAYARWEELENRQG